MKDFALVTVSILFFVDFILYYFSSFFIDRVCMGKLNRIEYLIKRGYGLLPKCGSRNN